MTGRLWHGERLSSTEYCHLEQGGEVTGVVLLPLDGRPARVDYRVTVDGAWQTRQVTVDLRGGATTRHLDLAVTGGTWTVNGTARPDLRGCLDVDLGCSPSTNTLPIRRLQLPVGESAWIDAAWVRFPEFAVERAAQHYHRLDVHRWRYTSGSFTADIEVDVDGVVHRYGEGIWSTVAADPPAGAPPRR